MDTRQTILAKLSDAFSPLVIEVIDESAAHEGHAGNGGGGHFHLRVVSELFRDKTAVQRHRMVYETLGAEMQSRVIHALSMELHAPGESD